MKRKPSWKWLKRSIGFALCLITCLGICVGQPVHAKEEVKITDKEYVVNMSEAGRLFISNDKIVSGEIGSKVFLTYTVEEVSGSPIYRNGVLAVNDNINIAPDSGRGKYYYSKPSQNSIDNLFEVGYTYVFRMERTEEGFDYHCAKMKGDETVTITFGGENSGSATDPYNYYGVFFTCQEGGVNAVLNHVRCYDERGNNLGVKFNDPSGMTNELLGVHPIVDSKYNFTIDNKNLIAISNKYPTDSDVVYMEYEVADVQKDKTYQQGLLSSWRPKDEYPHANNNGVILWKKLEKDDTNKLLLQKGAKYFVCFVKRDNAFYGIAQCTKNEKTENITFSQKSCSEGYQYFSLWFSGEGKDDGITATFKNVKCYDAKGNSLGIQINNSSVQISHVGKQEDYTEAKAVYYCKEKEEFIILDDKNKAVKQVGDVKLEYKYEIIDDDVLCLVSPDGKESYDYVRLYIRDEEGNKYNRLKNVKVRFVTDEKTIVAEATADNGYRVKEPESPVKEGNTFKGWCYNNGDAFDFDAVLTESVTLYAKWQNGDGIEYLATEEVSRTTNANIPMIIGITAGMTILASSAIACYWVLRRKEQK